MSRDQFNELRALKLQHPETHEYDLYFDGVSWCLRKFGSYELLAACPTWAATFAALRMAVVP